MYLNIEDQRSQMDLCRFFFGETECGTHTKFEGIQKEFILNFIWAWWVIFCSSGDLEVFFYRSLFKLETSKFVIWIPLHIFKILDEMSRMSGIRFCFNSEKKFGNLKMMPHLEYFKDLLAVQHTKFQRTWLDLKKLHRMQYKCIFTYQ